MKATPEISATGARFTRATSSRTGRRSPGRSSALERQLSATIMRGGSKPAIGRRVKGALVQNRSLTRPATGHTADCVN